LIITKKRQIPYDLALELCKEVRKYNIPEKLVWGKFNVISVGMMQKN